MEMELKKIFPDVNQAMIRRISLYWGGHCFATKVRLQPFNYYYYFTLNYDIVVIILIALFIHYLECSNKR